MTKTELKPCPFCSCNEVVYTRYHISGEHHVECLECAVLVVFDVDLDEKDIIAHWNTRKPAQKKETQQ